MPISEKTNDYALQVRQELRNARLRCDVDLADEKINAKIAKAHAEKLPYMLVVGPREAEATTVNVRIRGQKANKTVSVEGFIEAAKRKIADKSIDLGFA